MDALRERDYASDDAHPDKWHWVMLRAYPMKSRPLPPSKEQIDLLAPFDRLGLERIELISTPVQAQRAASSLRASSAWGFDTESKPTFSVGEASDGPHVVQLATLEQAWVFQLHDPDCLAEVAALLAWPGAVKAGFGLGDDRKRIQSKLGIEPVRVHELGHDFRQRGYRQQIGVKSAVALLFERRFAKSKKAATSNWSRLDLSESQLLYAANDAWAALRCYHALLPQPR